MGIWKNAGGGYRSGDDGYQEYLGRMTALGYDTLSRDEWERRYVKGHDIQLVRVPGAAELRRALERTGLDLHPQEIETVLRTLISLTPDGKDKKAWKEIHENGSH